MNGNVPTHYQVLGIQAGASEREIKLAYRKAARKAHPDHGGDAAHFRQVTEAYETLIDPARRAAYDRSYGANRRGSAGTRQGGWSASTAGPDAPAAGFRTDARPREHRASSSDPTVYVPAYESLPAGGTPLLARTRAAHPVHGAPRKRGLFGAQARLAREARTIQLLMQQVLSQIPSARLVNGLLSPADNGYIDHALLVGYRLVLLGSMMLPEGAYRWNGQTLVHGSKVIEPPRLLPAVRKMQELFPECNVTGWVLVHSPDGNLYQPVIDYARGSEPDGSDLVQVANGARLVREVKHFLGAGPAPNVVDLQVLSRLLGGMH
ncbi:J domain-containing protein [Pseudarthrobacter sp. P1]|uniref:J domain-containing protein n=1 Tax=Pseudarthrobacter sp. P1 TaxID=3418418 RepID=UPI003CEE0A80